MRSSKDQDGSSIQWSVIWDDLQLRHRSPPGATRNTMKGRKPGGTRPWEIREGSAENISWSPYLSRFGRLQLLWLGEPMMIHVSTQNGWSKCTHSLYSNKLRNFFNLLPLIAHQPVTPQSSQCKEKLRMPCAWKSCQLSMKRLPTLGRTCCFHDKYYWPCSCRKTTYLQIFQPWEILWNV